MDSTFTPVDGFEVQEIPPDDYVRYPVYRVTFTPTPDAVPNIIVGMVCGFPWSPTFTTVIFAPRADARYSWQTDDIDLGSFDTKEQAFKTITTLARYLWVPWLNNPDHVR